MKHIVPPTALSLADVLNTGHDLDAINPFGHFVSQLIFHPQPQRWLWWMAFVTAKQNAGCRSCESSSGIAVDVQQRLNCALPSFYSLKLWFLSIPKSSRHIQELSIE